MSLTREQEASTEALALIFASVMVSEPAEGEEYGTIRADGCEWPDPCTLAPRIVAKFEVDPDGTLRELTRHV